MKQFSVRYVMLDVALWAIAFGLYTERKLLVGSVSGTGSLFAVIALVEFWLALAGAALGGLFGRMKLGAILGMVVGTVVLMGVSMINHLD